MRFAPRLMWILLLFPTQAAAQEAQRPVGQLLQPTDANAWVAKVRFDTAPCPAGQFRVSILREGNALPDLVIKSRPIGGNPIACFTEDEWRTRYVETLTKTDLESRFKKADENVAAVKAWSSTQFEEQRKLLLSKVDELSKAVLSADTESQLIEALSKSPLYLELTHTVADLKQRVDSLEKKR
jgi:hypothetical protein